MTSKSMFLVNFMFAVVVNSIIGMKYCEKILFMYEELGCNYVNVLANDTCTGK